MGDVVKGRVMINSRTFSDESDYDQMLQMVRDTFAEKGLQ